MKDEGMQYTQCTCCGLSLDWGKVRTRGLICKRCGSKNLVKIDKKDWERVFDIDFSRELPLDIEREI